MPKTDKRVDAYIAKAPEYAKPILTTLRSTVHSACPDCEETLKWNMPAFLYNGGILCMMSAFTRHCTFHFWRSGLVGKGVDPEEWKRLDKIAEVSDLPSKRVLAGYVKRARELSELGDELPKRQKPKPKPKPKPKAELAVPDDMMAAMRKSKKTLAGFKGLTPSRRREYVEWIASAKGDETRARRLAQAMEWIAEGKPRNWKYM